MHDGIKFPKVISFSSLRRRLKKHRIYWVPRKGKGGHGGFVDPDKQNRKQAYPLPSSQQKEVRKVYLKPLCRRFGLTPKELFGD